MKTHGLRKTSRAVVVGMAAMATTVVCTTGTTSAQDTDDVCSLFGEVDDTRGIASSELTEVSGMVASRLHRGVIWAHNDSGDGPRIFAITEEGADLGSFPVQGARNRDWEDIAIGVDADGRSLLYIADLGDNSARRASVALRVVPEPDQAPDGSGGTLDALGSVSITYPAGAVDAEALIIDPVSGDAVIITVSADAEPRAFVVPASALVPTTSTVAQDAGVVVVPDGEGDAAVTVTAADVSRDGSIILLRTETAVLAYSRGAGETVVDALRRTPCIAPSIEEPSPQAITFTSDGTGYLLAGEVIGAIENGELPEGSASKLTRVEVLDAPQPPTTETPTSTDAPTTTEAPPSTETAPTTATPADTVAPAATEAPADTEVPATAAPDDDSSSSTDTDEESGSGLPIVLVAVGAMVVLALLVVLVVVRKQRRRPLPGSAPLMDMPPFDSGGSAAAGASGGFAAPPAAPSAGAPLPPPVPPSGGDETPPSGQPLPPPSS